MSVVDIVILVLLLFALIKGWTGGILIQLAGIAGIIAGIWVASRFSDWVAEILGMENASHEVMYVLTLVVVMIAVILLLKLVDHLLKSAGLSIPLRFLGVIFSVGKWLIILTLLLSVYKSIVKTWHIPMADVVKESIFYKPLDAIEENVFPYFGRIVQKMEEPKEVKLDNFKTV